jgi:hypothetical protein
MLRGLHLTDGIGVRTARNIPYTLPRDALRSRNLISVTSAEERKKTTTAQLNKYKK